jgi:hypothetical protein
MRSINRAAIVVRPKTPFFEWTQTLEDGPPSKTEPWTSVYLVTEQEGSPPESILRKHFKQIFDEQLLAWHLIEEDWPKQRTFSLFQKWFEADVEDLVRDLSNHDLRHDDDI